MKHLIVILIFTLVFSCKTDKKEDTIQIVEDTIELNHKKADSITVITPDIIQDKSIAIELKQNKLIEKKDERQSLETLIIEKKYLKEKEGYSIDFTYPLLNEKQNLKYVNFNDYINDYYVDISGTETAILESKALCDSIALLKFKENRLINYKVYNVNDDLISVVFYKENFYSGTLHPSYSFDCLNFDLNRGVFMTYEDFFLEGTEAEFTTLINEEINSKISKGELFYDCWELSQDDFLEHKNNFVLNETYIEYYFDDCIMCPSYTGSYSVEIPLVKLLSVIKKYDQNPLVF
ncbi:RsiV family protein [uncultured Lacinutrix sp.]|uniref:RsiV family protein n=1 Tax=uncultured Lacinutrix sp. TaxID=574032 RepID=UPI0026268B40|nr:RsiV family protein [uncultured Lacinutrix sp.]